MRKKQRCFLLIITLTASVLVNCAPPVSKEIRLQAGENLAFTKVLANPAAFQGAVVIWGGVIMKVINYPDHADLYLWETPQDVTGKPEDRGSSEGLFIARDAESPDPQIFGEGRKVTVAGEVVGQQLGTYAEQPYVYPVVKVKELHPWENETMKWEWGNVPYHFPSSFSPAPYR